MRAVTSSVTVESEHATVEGRDQIELAYAIRSDHWRKGFATEISIAALKHGFDELHLDQIVAFTLTHNRASRGVMEHCGFTYQRDIVHAGLPHVLYLLEARNFSARSIRSSARSPARSCHPDDGSNATGGRISDSFARAKPVPVSWSLALREPPLSALTVTLHLPN